jgi:hypothetical protein
LDWRKYAYDWRKYAYDWRKYAHDWRKYAHDWRKYAHGWRKYAHGWRKYAYGGRKYAYGGRKYAHGGRKYAHDWRKYARPVLTHFFVFHILYINVFGRHLVPRNMRNLNFGLILEETAMREKIPKGESALIDYGANIHYRNGKYASVLGLNAGDITSLETKRLDFQTLHGQCATGDQPKTVTASKNAAKSDLKTDITKKYITSRNALPAAA